MPIKVTLKWDKSPSEIVNRIISPDAKIFAATTWHRLYTPFTPMGDTGQLANNVTYLATDSGAEIEHNVVYALYQYNGAGFNFRRDKHPLASAQWDQTAKAAGKAADLAQSLQGYLGGG